MRLSIVVPFLGQIELTTFVINKIVENCTDPITEIIALDNGGEMPVRSLPEKVRLIRAEKNIGVYPTFKVGMGLAQGDVVAFFHSDLIITERGFDKRLLDVFEKHPKLGLVGFVGSTTIDARGGRGWGTTSNFQGGRYVVKEKGLSWSGSPAQAHGACNTGMTPAAVVDGCSMVIRRSAWEKIGYREDFPPHHFYDRLISCQMLENDFQVAVLGVACDHISGQTVGHEQRYHNTAKEWYMTNRPIQVPNILKPINWDSVIYREAEKMWLEEYRDKKHLIPIKI